MCEKAPLYYDEIQAQIQQVSARALWGHYAGWQAVRAAGTQQWCERSTNSCELALR